MMSDVPVFCGPFCMAICVPAGATVAAIVDSRTAGADDLGAEAEGLGLTVLRGHVVCDVLGRRCVRGVRIARWNGDTSATVDDSIQIDCDLVAM